MWAKQCFNGINVGIDHPSNHHFFWGGLFTIPSHGWFMALFYPHEVKRIKQWNYTRAQNPTFCASKSSSKSGSCRKMAVMPQSSHWKMENRIVSCIYILWLQWIFYNEFYYHGYLMLSMCVIEFITFYIDGTSSWVQYMFIPQTRGFKSLVPFFYRKNSSP